MFLEDEQNALEIDFLRSWERMEVFFGDDNMPWLTQMLPLIRSLRARGYDRMLRAGQSMVTFIVSRSRSHGLRTGQPFMTFAITQGGGLTAHLHGENVSVALTVDRVEITPEIEELLMPLLAYPIG